MNDIDTGQYSYDIALDLPPNHINNKTSKEKDIEITKNEVIRLQHNNSRVLLIMIYIKHHQKQDNQAFLEDYINNIVILIQRQADQGKMAGVICKNDNMKYNDFNNKQDIDTWIYIPCIIRKKKMRAEIFFKV